jgi:hypothetical protein
MWYHAQCALHSIHNGLKQSINFLDDFDVFSPPYLQSFSHRSWSELATPKIRVLKHEMRQLISTNKCSLSQISEQQFKRIHKVYPQLFLTKQHSDHWRRKQKLFSGFFSYFFFPASSPTSCHLSILVKITSKNVRRPSAEISTPHNHINGQFHRLNHLLNYKIKTNNEFQIVQQSFQLT